MDTIDLSFDIIMKVILDLSFWQKQYEIDCCFRDKEISLYGYTSGDKLSFPFVEPLVMQIEKHQAEFEVLLNQIKSNSLSKIEAYIKKFMTSA